MQNLIRSSCDQTGGSGLPCDRRALAAAHQAFADLKQTFLYALAGAAGADTLRRQVETAEEPMDLWLLRGPAFAALDGVDLAHRGRRQLLRRGLGTLFPDDEAQDAQLPS
jgi:hypothetical protein